MILENLKAYKLLTFWHDGLNKVEEYTVDKLNTFHIESVISCTISIGDKVKHEVIEKHWFKKDTTRDVYKVEEVDSMKLFKVRTSSGNEFWLEKDPLDPLELLK